MCLILLLSSQKNTIQLRFKEFFTPAERFTEGHIKERGAEMWSTTLLINIVTISLSLCFFSDTAAHQHFTPALGIPYWVIGFAYVVFNVVIYAKIFLQRLVGWTFFAPEETHLWTAAYLFVTGIAAVLVFPVSVFYIYGVVSATNATIALIIVAILYEIALFFKLFVNFKASGVQRIMIFLYLCSAELLPTAVLVCVLAWMRDSIVIQNILF